MKLLYCQAQQVNIGIPRRPSVDDMLEYRKDIPALSVQAVVDSFPPLTTHSRHRSLKRTETRQGSAFPTSSSALLEYDRTLAFLGVFPPETEKLWIRGLSGNRTDMAVIEPLNHPARKLSTVQTMRTLAKHELGLPNVLVRRIGSTKSVLLVTAMP